VTLSVITLNITASSAVTLNVVFYCYAACHYAVCCNTECRGAEGCTEKVTKLNFAEKNEGNSNYKI